jgi:hypothetical protein
LGIVILLLLAVIWAAVLIPPFVRARAESRPSGSITDFRRQLHVLARTTPGTLAPATSLGTARRVAVASGWAPPARPTRSPAQVSRARKRRRDVLCGLLVAMAGSLVLGALPALRVLWALHLVLDACFAGYVLLLVRMRNVAAEREMKLRFLPTAAPAEPALLLRRSVSAN